MRVNYTIPISLGSSVKKEQTFLFQGPDTAKAFYLLDGKAIKYDEAKKTDPNTRESINVIKEEEKNKEYNVLQVYQG